MKHDQVQEFIHSRIWNEEPEADNPFAAARCYCSGYDVYGDLLGKASWFEYLYLLFKCERPAPELSRLLEALALVLANPGPRDHSVQAACCAAVGGSTAASCLMAALAVGAGQLAGAREVYTAMGYWQVCGRDLDLWCARLKFPPSEDRIDVWPALEHPPGFDPYGATCPTPVRQSLAFLAQLSSGSALEWLRQSRSSLETAAQCPLATSGVAAAALIDLDFDPEQGEILYLFLRLPGAAAHALEQREYGWRKYPFFKDGLALENDPGPMMEI